jgi:hypothetical protein
VVRKGFLLLALQPQAAKPAAKEDASRRQAARKQVPEIGTFF